MERIAKRIIMTGEATNAVELRRILNKHYKTSFCVDTVKRILKAQGLNGRIRIKKPRLTKRHKKLRLKFAKKYKSWKKEDWEKVIFSDETRISRIGSDGKRYIWRKVGETLSNRIIEPTVKGGGGNIMIWGCFGINGVGHAARIHGHNEF